MKSQYYHTAGRKRRIKNPFKVSERGDDGKWSVCVQNAFFDGWEQPLQKRMDWVSRVAPESNDLHDTKKKARQIVDFLFSEYLKGMITHGLADTLP